MTNPLRIPTDQHKSIKQRSKKSKPHPPVIYPKQWLQRVSPFLPLSDSECSLHLWIFLDPSFEALARRDRRVRIPRCHPPSGTFWRPGQSSHVDIWSLDRGVGFLCAGQCFWRNLGLATVPFHTWLLRDFGLLRMAQPWSSESLRCHPGWLLHLVFLLRPRQSISDQESTSCILE